MRRFLRHLLLTCCCAAIPLTGFAQASSDPFLEARKAARSGDWTTFLSLKNQLVDHPLYPYLDYYYLRTHFNTVDDEQIEHYIRTNAFTPMAEKLRTRLLDEFADDKKWQDYLELYQPNKSVERQCDYLTALQQTGNKLQAYANLQPLWLSEQDYPENCMPLFDRWLAESLQKDELIWQRIDIALIAKKPDFAESLIDKLSEAKKAEAKQVLRVYKNPKLIKEKAFLNTKPSSEVISWGIARLARINPTDAGNTWVSMRKTHTFSEAQQQRMFQAIGLTLAFRKDKQATEWFRKVVGRDLPDVYQDWMIRSAVVLGDWQLAADTIEALPDDERNSIRWQYWYGRALNKLGKKDAAKTVLNRVSEDRSYYGFMACYYLNKPISVKHIALDITPDEIAAVKNMPGFQRAMLLFQLNLKHDARSELFTMMRFVSEKEQYIISKLVSEMGWYPQALRLAHYPDHKDDITVRFPTPYQDTILENAKKNGVDPALIYAIIRQESYFTPYANSHAGAIGLMQLLPTTATKTAKQFSLDYNGKDDLLDSKRNIQLGSAHIRKLYEQLGAHPALVIAAYNAGKKAARRWIPKSEPLPTDIWIETVTYHETRNYLRNVIGCYIVYQHRLGKTPNLASIMRPVGG